MNRMVNFARPTLMRLGIGVLLLTPLASAQAQTADKPADAAAYTLRMKFKQGNADNYKSVSNIKTTAPGQDGKEATTTNKATTVTESKVTKLLDKGGAELLITTKATKIESEDKNAPDPPKAPPVTMQMDALGKILSSKVGDKSEDSDPFSALLGSGGLSNIQSFLPEQPVKVGDKWTQKINLPGPLAGTNAMLDCTLVRMEDIKGYKTALIHAVMKMPMNMMMDAANKPTKLEADAAAIVSGTVNSVMDINFAVEEGKIVHSIQDMSADFSLKFGKAAPTEAASLFPDGLKIAMKMNTDMNILPPGVKVDEAAPEKKDK